MQKEKDLHLKIQEQMKQEEILWRQKSRINWLTTTDLNTKFYHLSTTIRRRRNGIDSIKLGPGNWTMDQNIIESTFINYFESIYASTNPSFPENLENLFVSQISGEENDILIAIPSDDEILGALKQIPNNKAPGPDGMTGLFFKHYWHIIKQDVIAAVQNFFRSGRLLKQINHTHIALIPKNASPSTPQHYRPISLTNVIYKLITKILANRLKNILPSIISPFQTAFVSGRNIKENSIIAHEMFHHLKNHRGKKGKMALKLDMEKAFDYIEWNFLFAVLKVLGFSSTWINLIKECITTATFSILINGSPRGFFKAERGLRQGDPISPFLFILCTEVLSRLLAKSEVLREIEGWELSKSTNNIWQNLLSKKYLISNSFKDTISKATDSLFWKGILSTRSLLAEGQCFKITNGLSVSVWSDPWIPTVEGFKPTPINHSIDTSSVMKVSELISHTNGQWNLPILRSLFRQDSINEILKIPLAQTNQGPDTLIWTKTHNGSFSVKTAHHLASSIASHLPFRDLNPDIQWNEIWNLKIHDRHKLLLWKIIWDILPTRERLKSFIPSLTSINCPLCDEAEETLLHLFIACPISRILWSQSKWPLNLTSLGLSSIKDWIQFILFPKVKLSLTTEEEHPFRIFAALILDFIWRLRNEKIHNQKDISLQKISQQLNLSYEENMHAWGGKFSNLSQKPWQNPPTNHLCISFDAAVRNSCSVAAAVSRNSKGEIIIIHTEKNLSTTPLVAEALAANLALKMAETIKFPRVSLVGDSQQGDNLEVGREIARAMSLAKELLVDAPEIEVTVALVEVLVDAPKIEVSVALVEVNEALATAADVRAPLPSTYTSPTSASVKARAGVKVGGGAMKPRPLW
ncbi:uncharacterized protein LOC122282210 [Carya illinoinensis]|uniref:uncharacterized protein LOC122282210 n=1 Tax=Carya illinoinensis TaxID=32201 RepID=UPI001C720901|nr:uncharacterized protein LOC122282210 [Carya illinoinensis]